MEEGLPRCYLPVDFDVEESRFSLHVFGDASEVAYGSVAYFRAEQHGKIHTAFVMARYRVPPQVAAVDATPRAVCSTDQRPACTVLQTGPDHYHRDSDVMDRLDYSAH